LVIGRMLGPAAYGELSSLLSLTGMLFVVFGFFVTVIVKFVASSEINESKKLFRWFTKRAIVLGGLLGVITVLSAPVLAKFLHVGTLEVILVGPILFFSMLIFVYRSFFQGLMKFKEMVVTNNLELGGRLVFGALLIYLGYSVLGAMVGILLSTVVAVLMSRYYLPKYQIFGKSVKFTAGKKVWTFAVPIFISTLSMNAFVSSDLILVKHFFSAHDAGIYSAISTLGKIIFYGTGPVGAVMFPLVSSRFTKGGGYKRIFVLSFLLTLAISLAVMFVYLVLPEFSVAILYGSEFLDVSGYLFKFGGFITVFTLATLILNYYISIEKTKVVYVGAIAALIQVFGIWNFHQSLDMVINVSLASSILLLTALLLYFGYESKSSNAKKTG